MFIFSFFIMTLLNYKRFTLTYDYINKVTRKWNYTQSKSDFGDEKRPRRYFYDPNVPMIYQQKSLKSYGNGYDLGHLVRSKDMSTNYTTRHEANYITNILPQVSSFNRGVWLKTELMASAIARLRFVRIYGGVIFNDTSNDYFLESHGVRTPDLWYKILISQNNNDTHIISWLIPNKENLNLLENYALSVRELEYEIKEKLDFVPEELKDIKNKN